MGTKRNIKEYLRKHRSDSSFKPVCFAASTGMHFSFNGKVYACHNNNNYAYGDLHEDSLLDIWNGKSRQYMARHLKKLNMQDVGCTQCLHDINKSNFNSVSALRYEAFQKYSNNEYPSVLGFRFSDMCNLQCRMCFSNQNSRKCIEKQRGVYNDAFFEQLRLFIPHVKYAYFSGGEPFFESLNFKVFSLFRDLNPDCRISVQTNGTILNAEIKEFLTNGKYDINVSIDSLVPSLFSSIRKGAELNHVLKNIGQFLAICRHNETEFSSCFTAMIDNCLELPSVIDYYNNQLNSKIWINKYYFPAKFAIWALPHEQIDELYRKLSSYQFSCDDSASKYNALQYQDFLKLLLAYKRESLERLKADIDFQTELDKQITFLKKEMGYLSGNDNIDLVNKLEVFKQVPAKQSYYYLKKLLEVFSGDKLLEIVLMLDEDFILTDLQCIK